MTGTTLRPAAWTSSAVLSRSDLVGQWVGNRVDIGADVDGDDVGTLLGQRDGMAAALAPRRAGDDGDGVV